MAKIAVRSEITGTVSFMDVDSGDTVQKAQTILSVECMKTMYPVTSPADGVITFHVDLGDVVENDALVATIEVP